MQMKVDHGTCSIRATINIKDGRAALRIHIRLCMGVSCGPCSSPYTGSALLDLGFLLGLGGCILKGHDMSVIIVVATI